VIGSCDKAQTQDLEQSLEESNWISNGQLMNL
jgi:hypothetical protein